jgi:DNA-binding transcriptional ArsR family regulator
MAVVARLCAGAASVGDLAQPFDMALPSFMQHLKILEQSGLVRSQKSGRVRTYWVSPAALSEAERWLEDRRTLWAQRLDRLDNYVQTLKAETP